MKFFINRDTIFLIISRDNRGLKLNLYRAGTGFVRPSDFCGADKMWDMLYKNIYFLGLKSGYMLHRFFRWGLKKIKIPLKAVGTVFTAIFFMAAKLFQKASQTVLQETKDLFSDMRQVRSRIIDIWKHNRKDIPRILSVYIRKALGRHGIVFRAALNVGLPVIAFAILCVTVSSY